MSHVVLRSNLLLNKTVFGSVNEIINRCNFLEMQTKYINSTWQSQILKVLDSVWGVTLYKWNLNFLLLTMAIRHMYCLSRRVTTFISSFARDRCHINKYLFVCCCTLGAAHASSVSIVTVISMPLVSHKGIHSHVLCISPLELDWSILISIDKKHRSSWCLCRLNWHVLTSQTPPLPNTHTDTQFQFHTVFKSWAWWKSGA